MSSRGIRNNNPGNIRLSANTTWLGQSAQQNDSAFVQFDDPKYGIRAIARIMASYERHGVKTIHDAINRWAPPNENDSDAYVSAVCFSCGIDPHIPVSLTAILPNLVVAIIRHENGSQPYTDQQIAEGIALA